MKQDILLVEDDRSLNRAVSLKLLREGYEVKTAFTLKQACELCRAEMPAFIICDIGLPDGSGLDFCIELREAGHDIMFLFLTALDTEIDMINGYEAGADDYVTKPFSLAVLISKVNAMMKRNSRGSGGSDSGGSDIIRAGDIILNLSENCVYKDSRWTAEAIDNLLDKGIKYSTAGSRIEIRVSRLYSFVRIDIEDRGIGIPKNEQNRIFRRFYRGDNDMVRAQEGSGVGLYLSRS